MKLSIFGAPIVGVALLMSGCVSTAQFGTEEYDDAWNELAKNSASSEFAHPIDLYLSEHAGLYSVYWAEATERREGQARVKNEGFLPDLVASNGSLFWMEIEPDNKIREVGEVKLSELEGLVVVKGPLSCLLCNMNKGYAGLTFLFRNALGDLIDKSSSMDLEIYSEHFLPYLRLHSDLVSMDPAIGREWFESEIVPQLPHPEVYQESKGVQPESVQRREENAENVDFFALPSQNTPRVTAPTLDA